MIEVYRNNPKSSITLGDCRAVMDIWLKDFHDGIDMIYIDPPPVSGTSYKLIQKVGINQGRITHCVPASESFGGDDYFAAIKDVIDKSRLLLRDSGNIFVHCTPKTSSVIKNILDSVFGVSSFVNEIILSFGQSANSQHHFGFSHETLLFYRKSTSAYFDPEPTATKRGRDRRNHMKKNTAPDGRVYYSMSISGKEYRYYEDDLIYLGDVWSDIEESVDGERIKYESERPYDLAERLILSACPAGGIVCDPFCGTGTLGYAAAKLDRGFIMCDSSVFAVNISKNNILELDKSFLVDWGDTLPLDIPAKIRFSRNGDTVRIDEYRVTGGDDYYSEDLIPTEDTLVESWSVGTLSGGIYNAYDFDIRTPEKPALDKPLKIPEREGDIYAQTFDIFGNLILSKIEK